MYIFLVIILGFLLRMAFIIKPEGLWNDEYVSWYISSIPFNDGFWQEILKQCHMPLYYVYLKPFSQCSDLILRLTSVIPSVFAIWIMYLIGKEHSETTAKYSAIITAVLPFLIYYSQEVRLYSLTFMLSATVLLFFIKILKNSDKKFIIWYAVTAISLIFTHVLGILYVFLLSLYLIIKKRILSQKAIFIAIPVFCLVIFFGINILKQLPAAQWWGIFSYTNILFLFSDFFSPILTNNINAPSIFYYNKEILFIFLITIPTIIAFVGICIGIKKYKDILLIPFLTITIMIFLAMTGKLVFITKYLTEILPLLILFMATGFEEKTKINEILFGLFIVISLFSIMTIHYPSKQLRAEGHNLPAYVINAQKPDKVIYTYYSPERFKRYLKINPKSKHISKINRFDYTDNPAKVLDDVKSGENVSIVFLDSVSFIPEYAIENAEQRKIPEMFITFSKIRHSLEKSIITDFNDVKRTKIGEWVIINGIKK